jgi:hypothetical protein
VVQRRDAQRRFVRDAASDDPSYTQHVVRWFRAMAIQRAWRRFRVRTHRVGYLQVGQPSLPPSGWAKGCVCDRAVQPSSPGHSPRLESRPGWSGRSEAERVMRVKGLQ